MIGPVEKGAGANGRTRGGYQASAANRTRRAPAKTCFAERLSDACEQQAESMGLRPAARRTRLTERTVGELVWRGLALGGALLVALALGDCLARAAWGDEPAELAGPVLPGAQWGVEATRDSLGSTEAGEAERERTGAQGAPVDERTERLQALLRQDGEQAARLVPVIRHHAPEIDDALCYAVASAVARSARNSGVRPELVLALIKVESDFDPGCESPTSDCGLMQLHRRCIHDVPANVAAGCAHLKGNMRAAGGDERASLAAYNGGPRPPGISWAYADRVLETERKTAEALELDEMRETPATEREARQ